MKPPYRRDQAQCTYYRGSKAIHTGTLKAPDGKAFPRGTRAASLVKRYVAESGIEPRSGHAVYMIWGFAREFHFNGETWKEA